jgi:hypothetical protein
MIVPCNQLVYMLFGDDPDMLLRMVHGPTRRAEVPTSQSSSPTMGAHPSYILTHSYVRLRFFAPVLPVLSVRLLPTPVVLFSPLARISCRNHVSNVVPEYVCCKYRTQGRTDGAVLFT